VDEARVDDQRLETFSEQVELRPLVSALVPLDEDAPVGKELPGRHRLGEVGQLPELAAARGDLVQLLRARHVRRHEQTRSVVGERERHRLPHLEQRPQVGHARAQAVTPATSGMISSPYAWSVSSWPCVMR
jgi:hypothetical protein